MLRTLAIVLALGSLTACTGGIDPYMPPTDDGDDPPPAGGPDAGTPPVGEPDAEPPPVNNDPLAEFSGCMNIADWDTAQMGTWAQKGADGGTVCSSCHGDGLAEFNTDLDNALMFEYNRYEVFITGFFTIGPVEGGGVGVRPAVDKLRAKGQGLNNHPSYTTNADDIHMQRLEQFFNLTNARKAAGDCGPAEFPQVPPPQQ